MIDFSQSQAALPSRPDAGRAVLRFRESDDAERTAGSMPVWERQARAQEQVADALNAAAAGDQKAKDFSSALAYAETPETAEGQEGDQEFGFGDLIDMINPLQHIPLVGQLYRSVTGDEIRPASRIIGDSIYGGPVGGAVALANVAVEYETGKDVAGNVLAMLGEGEKPSYRSAPDMPEQQLEIASRIAKGEEEARQELPGSVLSFADLGGGRRRVIERFTDGDMERTAGTMVRRYTEEPVLRTAAADFLPPREPITTLSFAPMKGLKEDDRQF